LDQRTKKSLANLSNITFIVYHPPFGYFADDYGLTMIALGKDITPAELVKILNEAKRKNIKVIFY